MVEVVAALICKEDQFLICQRPHGKHLELLWEFVGGKVESGESLPQAIVRECQEELGITVQAGEVFMEVHHTYPRGPIHLTLFYVTIVHGEPQLLEHNAMQWITVAQIPDFDFCPADQDILAELQRSGLKSCN